MAVQDNTRQREQDRGECLAEVMAGLAGTRYEKLVERVEGAIDFHRIIKNGRTYTVDTIVYADPETPGTLRIVFTVDDGGLHLTAPKDVTRFLGTGEVFTV